MHIGPNLTIINTSKFFLKEKKDGLDSMVEDILSMIKALVASPHHLLSLLQ